MLSRHFFMNRIEEMIIWKDDETPVNARNLNTMRNNISMNNDNISALKELKFDKATLAGNVLKFFANNVEKYSFTLPISEGENGTPGQNGKEIELRKGENHIEWRYVGEELWKQLIALEDLKGQDGNPGMNGKEVELRKSLTHIEWNYVGENNWKQLIALEELKGQDGGGSNVDINESNLITNAYMLVGSIKFSSINILTGDVTIQLDDKFSLNRVLKLNYASGKIGSSSIGIITNKESITLKNGDFLVWDSKTNTATVTTNESIRGDQYLIAYNNGGRIVAGLLAPFFDREVRICRDRDHLIKLKELPRDNGANHRGFHSMFICNNELITIEVPEDGGSHVYDLSDFENGNINYIKSFQLSLIDTNSDGSSTTLRLVACDYSDANDALVMGNSTNNGAEEYMKAYIFYEAKNWKDSSDRVTFDNCGVYTRINLNEGELAGRTTAKVIWDETSDNCLIVTSENAKHVFRILLGKGEDRKTYGEYNFIDNNKFNGTYEIIRFWTNLSYDYGCKDLVMRNGAIIHPIKRTDGGYYYQKDYLMDNGTIRVDRFLYDPLKDDGSHAIAGSPEGIVEYKGKLIMGHAGEKKFYVVDA